jgi:HSP20 family protein
MKSGRKNGKARSSAPERESGDPLADFLEDFQNDPEKPLKFLRSFMAGEESYSPAVDVVEEKNRITVIVDLPGVAEKDLRVEFVDGGLLLRGRREPSPEPAGSRLRRAERPAGEFTKSVPLPKGLNAAATTTRLENGVLTVTVPRAVASSDVKTLKAGTP